MSARGFIILRKTSLLILLLLVFSHHVYASDVYYPQRTIETPHPEEHGWFGSPTAMDGDLILISSWHADVGDEAKVGKAYLYNVDGDQIASYQSPIPHTLDTFSSAIDISGDRVLIGDCSSQGDLKDVGKAYLFDTDGNLIKTFEPPSPSSHYYGPFGGSGVCFVSNRIIISEVGGETEPALAGMVHMYDDEGTFLKAIYSPSPKSGGYFGQGVEDGDELFLVNEIGDDLRALPGTVYGFDYDGNHVMTLQSPEPEVQASFGISMDISGDKIIIGEHWTTVNDIYRAGRAYLFNTDGELLQTFESPSPDLGGQFGFAVSIEGDTVVIGEPNADVNPGMAEGKAYIFDVDGTLLQNLTAPSPGRIALYGGSVKINDGVIVVGEGWAEVDDEMRAGAVHIYSNEPQKPSQTSADFNYKNLNVSPIKVSKDKTATITVDCTNTGTFSGSTVICMNIDGDMIEEKTVTINSGQTKTVTFTYRTGEVGVHKVEIESLVSEYEVNDPVPGFSVNAIASGLLVTAYLIYQSSRKR